MNSDYMPMYAPMLIEKIIGQDWQGENIRRPCGYIAAECFVLSKEEGYYYLTAGIPSVTYKVVFAKQNTNLQDMNFDTIKSWRSESGYNIPYVYQASGKPIFLTNFVSNSLEETIEHCQKLTGSLIQSTHSWEPRLLEAINKTQQEIEDYYQAMDYPKLALHPKLP